MASQTSASASFQGLPASNTSSAARALRRARIHSAARNSTAARSPAGLRLQAGHARRAASRAASASAGPHDADSATIVLGEAGSTDRMTAAVSTGRPSITAGTRTRRPRSAVCCTTAPNVARTVARRHSASGSGS